MRCRYCGTSNAEGEHRCEHCGRRLQNDAEAARLVTYPFENSSAAPAPVYSEAPHVAPPAPETAAPDRKPRQTVPRQPSLFAADRPKVIPFESIAGAMPSLARKQAAEKQPRGPRPRRPEPPSAQQALDLDIPITPPPVHRSLLGGGHPAVAPVQLRMAAFVADAGVTAACFAVFLLPYFVGGAHLVLQRKALLPYAVTAAALAFFYRLFWCILRRETPGMRRFRLRVVNFDGYAPDPAQRLVRFAGACAGSLAGLGLLWALVDEEKLTWHDQMSKTYVTVADSEPVALQR